MKNLSDRQQQYLKFLLADFESIKAEIVRRSTLQRIVLVTYIAVLAFELQRLALLQLTEPLLAGFWVSGMLALLFYTREFLEIKRLGYIIRERIARIASNILRISRTQLFHSETNGGYEKTDKVTSSYDHLFTWTLFLFLPLIFTVCYFFQNPNWAKLSILLNLSGYDLCLAIISFISGIWTIYLLIKHHRPCKENMNNYS